MQLKQTAYILSFVVLCSAQLLGMQDGQTLPELPRFQQPRSQSQCQSPHYVVFVNGGGSAGNENPANATFTESIKTGINVGTMLAARDLTSQGIAIVISTTLSMLYNYIMEKQRAGPSFNDQTQLMMLIEKMKKDKLNNLTMQQQLITAIEHMKETAGPEDLAKLEMQLKIMKSSQINQVFMHMHETDPARPYEAQAAGA